MPVPEIVESAMDTYLCSYTHGLLTFELPARVPVTVDSKLEDGVADQSKALVGLWTVSRGRVEGFVEQAQVLEGVAESVADVIEVADGAGLFLEALLRLFLQIGRRLLALGGGGGCRGMGGGDVVGGCSDHVVRRCSSDGGGRHGDDVVRGQVASFVGKCGVDVLSRRGVDVLGGGVEDVFRRKGVVLVRRHRVNVVRRHGDDVVRRRSAGDVRCFCLYIPVLMLDGKRVYG